jgi:hypothetical protein
MATSGISMNALQAVEEKLGPISKWPSYIVRHMSYTEPNDTTTLKSIIAFFYGNGIEAEKAWKCYCMLNNSDEHVIREKMQYYYDRWTLLEVK